MQSAATRPLWPAFDLIKCACAVGMVLAHGVYFTWTVHGRFILPPESPWFTAFQWGMFLGVCPLALPFLAGAALRLRYAAPLSEHESSSILRTLALQSVVLAILGYLMNVLAAGWYDLSGLERAATDRCVLSIDWHALLAQVGLACGRLWPPGPRPD